MQLLVKSIFFHSLYSFQNSSCQQTAHYRIEGVALVLQNYIILIFIVGHHPLVNKRTNSGLKRLVSPNSLFNLKSRPSIIIKGFFTLYEVGYSVLNM